MIETLLPDGSGQLGDTAIPGAVPGDRLEAGALVPGPNRARPPCAHAEACGGCTFQHVRDAYLGRWKAERVVARLAAVGIAAQVRAVHASPARSRRRATLTGRRTKKTLQLGYLARASDVIVDVADCPLLAPALTDLLGGLRQLTRLAASRSGTVKYQLTQTETGVDLAVTGARAAGPDVVAALGGLDLARVHWNGEPLLLARPPFVRFGEVAVPLPPGAFLQATKAGEAALIAAVQEAVGTAGEVADLFCGCGTFALPLARRAKVAAFDGDHTGVAALMGGARGATGLKPVTAQQRDLFRRPLLAQELAGLDAAVLDPPRAGAAAQVGEIARAQVPVVAYVSCNPETFARDAAVLCAAGYALDWLEVVDQFRWSPHVELVARFAL